MADQLQLRGGTTAQTAAFTGAIREVTVDTDKDTLVVHDGAAAGGYPLMRENGSNSALALGTATTPSLKFSGDPNTGIYSPGADQLAISTNGTEAARIDSTGRLLIGTPTARSTATNNWTSQIETASPGAPPYLTGLGITTNTNATLGAYLSLAKTRGTSIGSNTIVQNGDGLGYILFSGADGTDVDTQAAYIGCEVDGTPGANDMPGRLVFSTTPDGSNTPTERLRIDQSGRAGFISGDNSVWVSSTAGAGISQSIFVGSYSAAAPYGGTVSIAIRTNGNVVNTNNSYGAISDLKLKENIVDASSQWNDLKALQVRNYNFKEGQTHTQIGLVAQEVELVSPGLVTESPDRDEEGNDLGTTTKSVNYSVLYMKAVKALQEAMERIETLETRLSALEGA
jgi:hypothetical protein